MHAVKLETTAYCGCGRCCGWEYGIGLGPVPVYISLAWRKRASGKQPIPLLPRMRRSPYEPEDRARGARAAATVAGVAGSILWAAEIRLPRGLPSRGGLGVLKGFMRGCLALKGPPRGLVGKLAWSARTPVAAAAVTGAVAGYHIFPVSRWWAETNLEGHRYAGTTASNTIPREPVPPLFSRQTLERPWSIPHRLLLFRWGGRDGTVAADTAVYPFGTRMHVPGYGWGVVEDRGGAIKGSRVDLYHTSHDQALRWGRQKGVVLVE